MKLHKCLIVLIFFCCADVGWTQSDSWKIEALEEVQQVLTPAPITNDTLNYTLNDESNLKSHNAASFYYRACLKWAALPKSHRSQLYEKNDEWLECSITELPIIEIDQWMWRNVDVLKDLNKGLSGVCDWGLATDDLTFSQQNEMGFAAEQAVLNEFGDILRLKARLHIARSEFDQAIESIAGCIKLGRDAGKLPVPFYGATMTSSIAFPALQLVNEIASMPDSPNLISALQSLPRPIANYLSDLKQQNQIIERSFLFLDRPEKSNRNDAQWRTVFLDAISQIDRAHQWNIERNYPNAKQDLDASREQRLSLLFAKHYPVAKRKLIEAGWDADEINSKPVGQVIAIQTKRLWDEFTKLHRGVENLPASKIHDRAVKLEQCDLIYGEFHGCFPLNLIVHTQQNLLRSHWQLVEIAMNLQLLRGHLANTGSFPSADQFEKMNTFPDPETGLPFQYRRLENGDAQLQSAPAFYERNTDQKSYVRVRYTIKKADK